ncbi:DEAD/DEAH box helicase family protein [Hahella ganghwensis]|uniref:DEAD/DEAH box helicase family protein n=1 Tax=Hahella ganghwensis TaxID=286420 RepID=UPI00036E0073|nr:DEAD/DEAH box helicase family protein [Hahella ganghwensis]
MTNEISLADFISDWGSELLDQVERSCPPLYSQPNPIWDILLEDLHRTPFEAQKSAIHAMCTLLFEQNERTAILNGKMGTGKTFMSLAVSYIANSFGYQRFLVLCPPHLVYKWAREVRETVPGADVIVLNGPATLSTLVKMRSEGFKRDKPCYYILGRVRMRMGYHWKPAAAARKIHSLESMENNNEKGRTFLYSTTVAACPKCFAPITNEDGEPLTQEEFESLSAKSRLFCSNKENDDRVCNEPLWTLYNPKKPKDYDEQVSRFLCKLPTIGPKTAEALCGTFGAESIGSTLADNVYDLVNLMDETGDFVFSDRQSGRIEKALGRLEFSLSESCYQASEFIKRYFPRNFFDLAIVDEAHEYSAPSSAQGQAMAVIASQVQKVLLCTGTLIKGYANDLFYLLWRSMGGKLRSDGYIANASGSVAGAEMSFMRSHGVLKEVFKETLEGSHKTARGNKTSVSVSRAPGISPSCITRYLLPNTVFVKLGDISDNLPPYTEEYLEVEMTDDMSECYENLSNRLTLEMRKALARGDTSLLGVVINCLLAWPETCFRPEVVKRPGSRDTIAFVPAIADEAPTPKEQKLLSLCKRAKADGIKTLVYTIYTGKRDTMARLKKLLEAEGLRFAVLRSTVPADRREEWIDNQLDLGVDGVICNPACVETGLDLLAFNQLIFMQTGIKPTIVEQSSKRSWRIGQKYPVSVKFLGYRGTAQIECMALLGQKIQVSQSASGEVPDCGLDALNPGEGSVEVALAKQLLSHAA